MRWHCVTIEDKHKIILHYGQKSSSGWNIYCRNECRYEKYRNMTHEINRLIEV